MLVDAKIVDSGHGHKLAWAQQGVTVVDSARAGSSVEKSSPLRELEFEVVGERLYIWQKAVTLLSSDSSAHADCQLLHVNFENGDTFTADIENSAFFTLLASKHALTRPLCIYID